MVLHHKNNIHMIRSTGQKSYPSYDLYINLQNNDQRFHLSTIEADKKHDQFLMDERKLPGRRPWMVVMASYMFELCLAESIRERKKRSKRTEREKEKRKGRVGTIKLASPRWVRGDFWLHAPLEHQEPSGWSLVNINVKTCRRLDIHGRLLFKTVFFWTLATQC